MSAGKALLFLLLLALLLIVLVMLIQNPDNNQLNMLIGAIVAWILKEAAGLIEREK